MLLYKQLVLTLVPLSLSQGHVLIVLVQQMKAQFYAHHPRLTIHRFYLHQVHMPELELVSQSFGFD